MDRKQACNILGVKLDAKPLEVKSAYRKMVLMLHPDRNGNTDEFKKVTIAYEILKLAPRKDPKPRVQSPRKSQWGATRPNDPPEQDWSKYTKEFEKDESFWKEYERKFWDNYEKSSKGEYTEFEDMHKTEQVELAVSVESSLCIGCCSCEIISPNVFTIDKKKQTNPKSTVHNRRGDSFEKIMSAAETCPTKAILVNEFHTGKRIYPF